MVASQPALGVRAGLRAVVPIAVAVVPFGLAFGVLAGAAGIPPLAQVVMSATTFAGSAQFAVASVLGVGGGWMAATAAAALLNARYVPIGASAAPALGGPAWRRLLAAQLVVDESWAVATLPDGSIDRGRLLAAGGTLWVVWTSATAVGAFGAASLGDPMALGVDAAFPALFLALLRPRLAERDARGAALAGACVALAATLVAPPGLALLAAAAVALWGLRR